VSFSGEAPITLDVTLGSSCGRIAAAVAFLVLVVPSAEVRAGRSPLPQVNVSRAPLPQAEVRVVADPNDPQLLLAGSNSEGEGAMRAYSSTDGGASWDSTPVPLPEPPETAPCFSDPAPAIDRRGRELFVFMQSQDPCAAGGDGNVTLRLASRAGPSASWSVAADPVVPPDPSGSFDDNPWLAVDTNATSPHANRAYLAWFRTVGGRRLGLELSFSDDGGLRWSEPKVVSDRVVEAGYPSVAVAEDGTVYVAWHDFARGLILVDRSTDGGVTFGRDRPLPVRERDVPQCPNGHPIDAQPLRCIRSDPTVLVDRSSGRFHGRVYVTYSDLGRDATEDVFVRALTPDLRPLPGFPRRIVSTGPRPARGDQFWPTSVVDGGTGEVWLCFYDTRGSGDRRRAWFSCAVGRPGGGKWTGPVRVATVASDERRPGAAEFAYGDYEGLAVAEGVAHPMWTDSRELTSRAEEIYTTRLTAAELRRRAAPSAPPRAGANVDVSRASGAQDEAAIAVDLSDARVRGAGSNSELTPMQAYGSTDGGLTWSRAPVPPDRPEPRCVGDPTLGIDRLGRQYFAYVRDSPCSDQPPTETGVYVSTRRGSSGAWSLPADPVGGPLFPNDINDKPSLAVDTSRTSPFSNRVYVVWSRGVNESTPAIVLSHSDDGGKSWSAPVRVNDVPVDSGYSSVATGPDGSVYVAWHAFESDALLIDVSRDGGDHFGPDRLVDRKRNRSTCPASWPIPAQARRCVRPNPVVTVDNSVGSNRGRVYVTYGNKAGNGSQDVYVASFDDRLAPLLGTPATGVAARIGPADGPERSDQFWPASTVDASTGELWACYYDTRGNASRTRARYSCRRSDDGGRSWSGAARASAPSDETWRGASPLQYGDYEGVAAADGVAHPIWTDSRRRASRSEEIYTSRVR
jgi:hypothetical protein